MTPADLIDRVSILKIKMEKLGVDLSAEMRECHERLDGLVYEHFIDELEKLNRIGWDGNQVIVDAVRREDPISLEDHRTLWRQIKRAHLANMERHRLKNEINRHFGHNSKEIKSWS